MASFAHPRIALEAHTPFYEHPQRIFQVPVPFLACGRSIDRVLPDMVHLNLNLRAYASSIFPAGFCKMRCLDVENRWVP